MIEWGLIVKDVRYSGFRREAAYNILTSESVKKGKMDLLFNRQSKDYRIDD